MNMVQEVVMPIYSYFALTWSIIIISTAILAILFAALFKKKKYALAIGGITGFTLAIMNTFAFGMIGMLFWFPFSFFCRGGESCWGIAVLVGDVELILLGFFVGWIIGKINSKKQ
jgi:hypothetical protein